MPICYLSITQYIVMSRIVLTQIPQHSVKPVPRLAELLSSHRREKMERYKNAADRALCLITGLAVIEACADMYGASSADVTLVTERNHSPYALCKGKKMFASISHSDNYAAVASAISPCGIDIEHKNRSFGTLRAAVHYFHPNEQRLLYDTANDYQSELFYLIWTVKEAYLKYLGIGLAKRLDSFFVNEEDGCIHIYDEEYAAFSEASVLSFNYGNNTVSAVSDSDIESINAVSYDEIIRRINTLSKQKGISQ